MENKIESAFQYKTPQQFILELGYSDSEQPLYPSDILELGKQYLQSQIISPDDKLIEKLVYRYYQDGYHNQGMMHVRNFVPIMISYIRFSGSQKLKWIVDVWDNAY